VVKIRFRKLRMAVGASLVVFVLVAGIIIAAGMLNGSSQDAQAAVQKLDQQANALVPALGGDRQQAAAVPASIQVTPPPPQPDSVALQDAAAPAQNSNPGPQAAPSPVPVQPVQQPVIIRHRMVRTSAS
jgi:hypothetical protein